MRNADSINIVTETIPVFREVGDGSAATALPLIMTHAESLAIAEAVLKRQAAQKTEQAAGASGATDTKAAAPATAGATGTKVFVQGTGGLTEVNRDQIIAEVSRIFTDSMARAIKEAQLALAQAPRIVRFGPSGGEGTNPGGPPQSGSAPGMSASGNPTSMNRSFAMTMITPSVAPPSDGRLRIVVAPFQNTTGKREFTGATRDIANVLRASIPADKYDVIADEMTDRASRTMPDRMSIGWSMRADYLITGMITARQDSVVYVTQWFDVRTGRFTRMSEAAAPVSDPRRAYDLSKAQVAAWLDTASTIAQRRRNGGPGGGPNGGRDGRGGPPAPPMTPPVEETR
jgi:serine/threonine-protein kinase